MYRLLLLLPLLLASGCAHRSAGLPSLPPGYISPMEAVRAAQDDPDRGITGVFALTVQDSGSDGRRLFLNSERDYRHPLNISLSLDPALRPALENALGLRLEQLPNRRLLARGTALRVRIDFTSGGRPSGKYYYQTQIQINDAAQLRWAP